MCNRLYETVDKQQERTQLCVHDWRANGVGVQLTGIQFEVVQIGYLLLDTNVIARRLRDK